VKSDNTMGKQSNGTNGYHALSSADPGHILDTLGIDLKSSNAGLVGPQLVKTATSGEIVESSCPSTGKVLASVQTVRGSLLT
jgi:hypothetical protein